ncbi:conserved Plasmodium protein, unknown function [Plasmodium berghei]|uniref:Uncharacterized protein n=2 Tax=Plasmodium berghei TaxID=5821 RepID=A0A509AIS3_PLABA|nr:conserved protein, unknown function [Plasmodium berghei ANKA]CXI43741.1 conserved Plasmodium protein, unknown function [Plasmodium berghei]SCM22385.1 conserved Plasmodium protein, unknown function [Plasmodium berghei]SCN25412.1 conserved Plasmodium protein, unknown function [Plasmodium berghei]SCO60390.1 conserved Plasmodium protein, unknown function [Plasmodium berghei]SCO62152.1 conserved Plasmodium protein, unknown function [Plasmodium berghei]|eukprot:XP_034421618.1 conserved protein, unknown function [Plasmodium berghei ANKA]
MSNNSLLLKAFIFGSPFGILLFNELNRIKHIKEDEKLNKSIFLKTFHKSNIIKNDEPVSTNRYKQDTNFKENDDEALNYFYGKSWGYTTDYEIDISLNSGDLIFIKHDLDNVNFFKKTLLKINRYFQNNYDYDEIGIILKKHNISYVYIQNFLNKKEKFLRYSHFLQKYKPFVVSLRRFISNDEQIKKKLHENILESIDKKKADKYNHSIFLNILYNIFKRKSYYKKYIPENSCLCNDYITCKQINSNIDTNNLINLLLFRSFNLFFYFTMFIKNESLKIGKTSTLYINQIYNKKNDNNDTNKNVFLNETLANNNNNINEINSDFIKSQKEALSLYKFPLNSLTMFKFIEKDYELMNKEKSFIYEQPKEQTLKEIKQYISLLIENEYTLMDSIGYMENVIKKGEGKVKNKNKYINNINESCTHHFFVKTISSFFEKLYLKLKRRVTTSYHVYEIYKKTNLLPSVNYYNFPTSCFLCLKNFYKPLNTQCLVSDQFNISKLSNLFHVRQEETEKLQKKFYQFNKVPK